MTSLLIFDSQLPLLVNFTDLVPLEVQEVEPELMLPVLAEMALLVDGALLHVMAIFVITLSEPP